MHTNIHIYIHIVALVELRDGNLLDARVHLASRHLLGDAVVVVAVAARAEALYELLIVRDHDQLNRRGGRGGRPTC